MTHYTIDVIPLLRKKMTYIRTEADLIFLVNVIDLTEERYCGPSAMPGKTEVTMQVSPLLDSSLPTAARSPE